MHHFNNSATPNISQQINLKLHSFTSSWSHSRVIWNEINRMNRRNSFLQVEQDCNNNHTLTQKQWLNVVDCVMHVTDVTDATDGLMWRMQRTTAIRINLSRVGKSRILECQFEDVDDEVGERIRGRLVHEALVEHRQGRQHVVLWLINYLSN